MRVRLEARAASGATSSVEADIGGGAGVRLEATAGAEHATVSAQTGEPAGSASAGGDDVDMDEAVATPVRAAGSGGAAGSGSGAGSSGGDGSSGKRKRGSRATRSGHGARGLAPSASRAQKRTPRAGAERLARAAADAGDFVGEDVDEDDGD